MSIQAQAQLLCFNEDQITSITAIKAESLPTNVYLQIYVTSVKFLYVFTICVQIYIIVVKLITIRSCITSFAYLRISAVIITDNVQRNLSRGVFKLYLRIMYNTIYLGVFKLYLRIMYNAVYVGVFKLYLLQVDYYRENFVSRQS